MSEVLEVHIPRYVVKGFALTEIEFHIESGYLTSLFGLNGAGKTTLLKLLTGEVECPEDCEIKVCGYSMRTEERQAKSCIGIVLDDSPFNQMLTPKLIGDVFGRYYDEFDADKYREWLTRFEIPVRKKLRHLSKGMNIKVQLAFALSHGARLLLMDEPTASLDPVFREEFAAIVSEVLEQEECGILISSQLVEEMESRTDYVLMLEKGLQVYYGSMEELLDRFVLVRGRKELFEFMKSKILGVREGEFKSEAIIYRTEDALRLDLECVRPHVEDLMYYLKAGILRKEMLE